MRPQGLRPGLYASTCPPLLSNCRQNLVQYFKLAYVFQFDLNLLLLC